jgi:hypothetical protein
VGRARFYVCISGVAAIIAGCGSSASPIDSAQSQWLESIDAALIEHGDISDAQRALVDEIRADGRVDYDLYAAAAFAAMDCIEDLGFIVDGPQYGSDRGQVTISWGQIFHSSDEADWPAEERLGYGCYRSEMSVVDRLYQTQPSAIEWEQDYMESFRIPLTECLEQYGVDTGPADAPIEDLLALNTELMSRDDWTGPDCTDETGMFAPP